MANIFRRLEMPLRRLGFGVILGAIFSDLPDRSAVGENIGDCSSPAKDSEAPATRAMRPA